MTAPPPPLRIADVAPGHYHAPGPHGGTWALWWRGLPEWPPQVVQLWSHDSRVREAHGTARYVRLVKGELEPHYYRIEDWRLVFEAWEETRRGVTE